MFFKNRNDFINIIDIYNYQIGIEIGIRDGGFSELILTNSRIKILYGVDIKCTASAILLQKKFRSRFHLIEGISPYVARHFANNYFDFIHIDACHKYEHVKNDMLVWWQKLKTGGVLSGDDYWNVVDAIDGQYGVVAAVNEFVDTNGLQVYVTGTQSNNRKEQIDWSDFNANQYYCNIVGKAYDNYQTPAWYIFK